MRFRRLYNCRSMKFRGAILLQSGILLVAVVVGQTSAQDDLPSAPSAVQQQRSKPKPPPPPPPAQTQTPSPTPSDTSANKVAPGQTDAESKNGAAANSSQNSSDDAATTITKTVNEVNVVFTVTDKHGRYVKNLAKADFSVLDDSKPAEQIRSFHNETDLPLQVGLLVDASNSVRDRFKFEQESAIEDGQAQIRQGFRGRLRCDSGSYPRLHRQHRGAVARGSRLAARRRYGNV